MISLHNGRVFRHLVFHHFLHWQNYSRIAYCPHSPLEQFIIPNSLFLVTNTLSIVSMRTPSDDTVGDEHPLDEPPLDQPPLDEPPQYLQRDRKPQVNVPAKEAILTIDPAVPHNTPTPEHCHVPIKAIQIIDPALVDRTFSSSPGRLESLGVDCMWIDTQAELGRGAEIMKITPIDAFSWTRVAKLDALDFGKPIQYFLTASLMLSYCTCSIGPYGRDTDPQELSRRSPADLHDGRRWWRRGSR